MPLSPHWVASGTCENSPAPAKCRVAEFLTREVLIQLQKGANLQIGRDILYSIRVSAFHPLSIVLVQEFVILFRNTMVRMLEKQLIRGFWPS
jgi:hypothetical protein